MIKYCSVSFLLGSFTSTLPRPRSRDLSYEDYSSNSQNETSLYSPVSYISRTQSKKSNTLTKKFSAPLAKQRNNTLPKHSPLVKKAASFIHRASSGRDKKPPPVLSASINEEKTSSKGVLEPPEISHLQDIKPVPLPSEQSKMNTLTRAEITDLNDLLSMFDENEKIDASKAIDYNDLDSPDKIDSVNSQVEDNNLVKNSPTASIVSSYNTLPKQTKILHEEPYVARRRFQPPAATILPTATNPPNYYPTATHSQLQKNKEETPLNGKFFISILKCKEVQMS